MIVKIKKLDPNAIIPRYAHPGDAGMDLYVPLSWGTFVLWPGEIEEINHGFAIEIPEGYFGLVKPRSGWASRFGLSLCSSGIIDSGYRGPIITHWTSDSHTEIVVNPGDKIGQMVLIPVLQAELVESDELSETARGTGGHGSTGR